MADNLSQYIVVRNRKPFTANKVHDNIGAAATEAERLARKEKDTFFVFELAGVVRVEDPPLQ